MNIFNLFKNKNSVSTQLNTLQKTILKNQLQYTKSYAEEVREHIFEYVKQNPTQKENMLTFNSSKVGDTSRMNEFGFTDLEHEKTEKDLQKMGFTVQKLSDLSNPYYHLWKVYW